MMLMHFCWQVDLAGIRPTPEVAEVYQGVSAPKRKRVEEQPVVTEIPKVGPAYLIDWYMVCLGMADDATWLTLPLNPIVARDQRRRR